MVSIQKTSGWKLPNVGHTTIATPNMFICIILCSSMVQMAPIITTSSSTLSSSSPPFSDKTSFSSSSSTHFSVNNTSPNNSSSSSSLPQPIMLSFPPQHCLKDSDCIGKNSSSKIFYDPNGRCDIRQNQCVCRDQKRYKRVQIKVNLKNNHHHNSNGQHSSQTSANNNNNNNQIPTIIYVSKCVLNQDSDPTQPLSANQDQTSIVSIVYNQNPNGEHEQKQQPPILSLIRPSHHHQYYGQKCDDDRQCLSNLICRQLIIPTKHLINQQQSNSTSNSTATMSMTATTASSNLARMLTVNRTKRCRCPKGQHWNKYNRRCEWMHSDSLFQFGLAPPSIVVMDPNGGSQNGNNNFHADHPYSYGGHGFDGSIGGSGSSLHHHTQIATNIDLKIFEIVLEIAFLVACLLGYKACSSICCREDKDKDNKENKDDGLGFDDSTSVFGVRTSGSNGNGNGSELKSDEESILSSSLMKSSTTGGVTSSSTGTNVTKKSLITTTQSERSPRTKSSVTTHHSVKQARRLSRKRRMSRFCARTAAARRNSTSGSSPYYSSGSSAYYYNYNSTNQNFRRLSSVSASAMSHSSSSSTKNLLVKINNLTDEKSKSGLSVSTILAPSGGGTGSVNGSRTPSPCYNCRIYKEVYSPSARCKSCNQSSLLSVATSNIDMPDDDDDDEDLKNNNNNNSHLIDFDALMLMVGGGSRTTTTSADGDKNNNNNNSTGQLDRLSPSTVSSSVESSNLAHHQPSHKDNKSDKSPTSMIILPPPYKQKPIRRSEEVGVPPHLRAPYRDSQPFWLK